MVRKLLFLLLSSLLFTGEAFAALSVDVSFEFSSSADANMVNGGGFKDGASGVDYSLQNSAQWGASDGTSTASTTFISLTSTFDSTIVGNTLNIASGAGATVGIYEVTGYTDANTITLDRVSGTYTAAVFKIGGALNVGGSLEDDFFEMISGANAADGIKVYIKAGSYTLSEVVSVGGSGGTQAPIVVEGYNTIRGDNPTGANRPTITMGANGFTGGTNFEFYNLSFTGSGAPLFTLGSNGKVVNSKFTNTSSTTGRQAILLNGDFFLLNNEFVSYWGEGVNCNLGGNANIGNVVGNYIHDSDTGLRYGATGQGLASVLDNLIVDNVTYAVRLSSASAGTSFLNHNTLYGAENTVGIGVSLVTGVTDFRLLNNIIYGFATGVSHADAAQTVGFDDYNAYNNNDTDVTNWTKGANDSTAAPGFTNVTQVTGTTGAFVAGGSKLVDTTKNFTTLGVAANDIVYITGGTGSTTRKYLINSISTTTNPNDTLDITVPASPGTNTTADKTYQITLGHDFSIGTNLKALGFPGAFQGGTTTGYMDIGGVQRQEAGGTTTDVFGMIQ